MYIDNNDVRTPRERVDGELLRQNTVKEGCSCRLNMPRGCNDAMRGTRPVRSAMPGMLPRGFSDKRSMPVAAMRDKGKSDCGCKDMRDSAPRCGGGCGTDEGGWGLHEHPLAMAYSPLQVWRNVYEPEIGLERGTIFIELDKPFKEGIARGGCCNG